MNKKNYLETEEYKNMIKVEKDFFEDATKKLEDKDIEILYFDKENIAYKKYQKLRFETQKYYIDGLIKGMEHEEAYIYSKKEAKKIILYSLKFSVFISIILTLLATQNEVSSQNNIIEGFLLILFIIFSATAGITTEASKIIPYKFAKILGSISGIIAVYLYGIFF